MSEKSSLQKKIFSQGLFDVFMIVFLICGGINTFLIGDIMYSPHGAAEFFICHTGVLLLLAPHLSHGLRLEELEDTLVAVLPLHQTLVLFRVNQDIPDEFPQVSATRCCQDTKSLVSQVHSQVL